MKSSKQKRHGVIHIKPGIFDDETYGIYLVPENNQKVEYQFRSQIKTIEEAKDMANELQNILSAFWVISSVEINETREELELSKFVNLKEEELAKKIEDHLIRDFTVISKIKDKPLKTLVFLNPLLLTIVVLLIYFNSWQIKFPEEIPILGWIIGGKLLGPVGIAKWFPLTLLILVIIGYLSNRTRALREARMKDYLINLAILYKWRRLDFYELFIKVMNSDDTSAFFKFVEDRYTRNYDNNKNIFAKEPEIFEKIDLEDFERKIHALVFINKEKDYRAHFLSIQSFFFVISYNNVRDVLTVELAEEKLKPMILKQNQFFKACYNFGSLIGLFIPFIFYILVFWISINKASGSPFWLVSINILIIFAIMFLLFHRGFSVLFKKRGFPRDHTLREARGITIFS